MKITKVTMFLDDVDPNNKSRLMRVRVSTLNAEHKEETHVFSEYLSDSDLVCAGAVALDFAYRHFKRSIFGGQ